MDRRVQAWIDVTLLLKNDWGEMGTGFLIRPIMRNVGGTGIIKFLIVTNKHVLNNDPALREEATEITIYLLVKSPDGRNARQEIVLSLIAEDGTRIWRQHPDADTDILVIDVTELILNNTFIVHDAPGFDAFVDAKIASSLGIAVGSEVLTVGFPDLDRSTASEPILRQGMIASTVGQIYSDIMEGKGGTRERRLKGFILDGMAVPGSSGSPVILKPYASHLGRSEAPPFLVGILAEALLANVQTKKFKGMSFAGMGFAFDVTTIKDTVNLFYAS